VRAFAAKDVEDMIAEGLIRFAHLLIYLFTQWFIGSMIQWVNSFY
jgi:hypothetical protein